MSWCANPSSVAVPPTASSFRPVKKGQVNFGRFYLVKQYGLGSFGASRGLLRWAVAVGGELEQEADGDEGDADDEHGDV